MPVHVHITDTEQTGGGKTSSGVKKANPKPTEWINPIWTPDLFASSPGSFSVLPHECASFYYGEQSIADSTWTTPTVNTTDFRTWYEGMSVDSASGTISFTGLSGESLFLAVGGVSWDANNTNQRWAHISVSSMDFEERKDALSNAAHNSTNLCVGMIRSTTTDTEFTFQVWQDSGGALTLNNATFVVARIR